MSKAKLKGVCVGAGYFSRFQYEAWGRIPEVEIVANCNRHVERAKEYAEEFGISTTYSYDDFAAMLDAEKPDFVDIITPPETHLELCKAAAERGIGIICQKPLAPTHEESVAVAKVAQGSGARFMVHENWRWQPWYREIKTLLDAGTIGDPVHLNFHCRMGDGWGDDAYLDRQPFFRDYPRLFIFETGVHFLDTFRYLLGEAEAIYARTKQRNPVIKGEDSALIICDFKNGATAVLDANRYNESLSVNPRYTFGALRLDGSQGHLEFDANGAISVKRLGEEAYRHEYAPATGGFAGNCVYAVQRHFVDRMLDGAPFESEVEDYLKTIELVEVAYRSAAENAVIPIQANARGES
jgi:predicted dehydrogenase